MKKFLLAAILILGFGSANAQELVWHNNLDNAIEVSQKTGKPILLFFTGSDWCGWCHRLQNEVFKMPEFTAWANQNVVLMEVDFPRYTALTPAMQNQNNHLQQEFAVQGYPTVWFVNSSKKDGQVTYERLGSTGYLAGGPTVWINTANTFVKKK